MPGFVTRAICRAATPVLGIALAALVVACREEEAVPEASDTPTASASPATATAEAAPTATAQAAPTASEASPTREPSSGPTPLSGKTPDGCLPTELPYVDPEGYFAFCYPSDMELAASALRGWHEQGIRVHGIGANVIYRLEGDASLFSAGVVWQLGPSSIDGRPCTFGEFGVKERVEPFSISGLSGQVCLQERYRPEAPEVLWRMNKRAELPVSFGRYLVMDVTYAPGSKLSGMAVEEIAARWMDSLVLHNDSACAGTQLCPESVWPGKAPDDCLYFPELKYIDPDGRFALCYPGTMEVSTVPTDKGVAVHVMHPNHDPHRLVSASLGILREPYDGPCDFSEPFVKNESTREFVIDGIAVPACFRDHHSPSDPSVIEYRSIDLEIQGSGGSMIVSVGYKDGMREFMTGAQIAMRLLASIDVY